MKAARCLQSLIDEGLVNSVQRQLMSGKGRRSSSSAAATCTASSAASQTSCALRFRAVVSFGRAAGTADRVTRGVALQRAFA
jgi:hypothetical protein